MEKKFGVVSADGHCRLMQLIFENTVSLYKIPVASAQQRAVA